MNKLKLFSLLLLLSTRLLCMQDYGAGAGGYEGPSTNSIESQLCSSQSEMSKKTLEENLIKAWPRLRNAIIKKTPNAIAPDTSSPEQIKEWLNNQENSPAIKAVNFLNLSWLELTALPEEISLFANLKGLDISFNELTIINIPETMANLCELDLSDNKLTKINIPNTLTELKHLFLINNKLQEINIPNTLTKLEIVNLNMNRLLNINIPESLINLIGLHLNQNRLKSINISNMLVKLKYLNLANNRLSKLSIPNTLTNLEMLVLVKNKLTPKATRIPAKIRAQAKISEDPSACPSILEEYEGAGGEPKD